MSLGYGHYNIADVDVPNAHLSRGVGAYELLVPLHLKLLPHKDKYTLRIDSARVFISGGETSKLFLGVARPDEFRTIKAHDFSCDDALDMRLTLQPHQLAEVEKIRDGGDFQLKLEIRGEARLGDETNRSQDDKTIYVARSEWVKQLKNVGFMDVMLIEVPMPIIAVPEKLETVRHALEEAQRHFVNAEYASCVASCRTAVQELGHHLFDDKDWATGALMPLGNDAKGMTKDERETALYAVVRHYTHQAHHGEGEGGARHYSRTEAQMILRLVAALVSGAMSKG